MAWKAVLPMEERIRFVLMASREAVPFSMLCAEFGISRRIGYKWLSRYRTDGLKGMYEHSRRPLSCPSRTPEEVERLIIKERLKHRTWGPLKLREVLACRYDLATVPAASTIGSILTRHGLTVKRRRRRVVRQPLRELTAATRPNEVWPVDFKGWFRTGDGQRCDPLTVSDLHSRFVLMCESVAGQSCDAVFPAFTRLFRRRGLPEIIRADNGAPFGSKGACGLSRLSAWWIMLGIDVQFIEPGHPEQNGAHERMHRTLKAETARPPAASLSAQQRRFDSWRHEFNNERPHGALGMQKPAQCYERSARRYRSPLRGAEYPGYYERRRVRTDGTIKWQNRFRYIGEALGGVNVGLTEVEDGQHEVYLSDLLLGYIVDGEGQGLRAELAPPPWGRPGQAQGKTPPGERPRPEGPRPEEDPE